MDGYIQALNGSEKSAKSVGIYSTNASASFHHFLLPLPFYSLHPRNIRGNQQRGHYRNSNFVCTRSLEERSRTQSGHLSKGGGGEGKKKEGENGWNRFFLSQSAVHGRVLVNFFTESPRWKEISASGFLSIADGTHMFVLLVSIGKSSSFFLSRNIHTMNESVLLLSTEDPPREIFQDWRIFETEGDWTCFSNEDERILLLVWRRIFIFSSREYISTKIDRNGQVWRRVLAACTTIFFFFFFPSTLRSHTLAVKGG